MFIHFKKPQQNNYYDFRDKKNSIPKIMKIIKADYGNNSKTPIWICISGNNRSQVMELVSQLVNNLMEAKISTSSKLNIGFRDFSKIIIPGKIHIELIINMNDSEFDCPSDCQLYNIIYLDDEKIHFEDEDNTSFLVNDMSLKK